MNTGHRPLRMKGAMMTPDPLGQLYETICVRAQASSNESYSARLIAGGPSLAGRKLSEEAVETLIAAMQDDDAAVVSEAADVLYHLLALLATRSIPLQAVYDELARRSGQSGLAEKASRNQSPS